MTSATSAAQRTGRRSVAIAGAVTSLLITSIGAVFVFASWDVPVPPQSFGPRGFSLIFAVTLTTTGWLLATKRAENPIGWVTLFAGLTSAVQGLTSGYALWSFVGRGDRSTLTQLAAVGDEWIWMLPFTSFALLLCLFPNGRALSRRWWVVIRVFIAVSLLAALAFALSTRQLIYETATNPLGIRGMYEVGTVATSGFFALLVAGLISVVVRFRRATGDEREQMKWLAMAAGGVVASFAIYLVGYVLNSYSAEGLFGDTMEGVITIAVMMTPVSIGIAVTRYRLYDIDIVIRKTVVYAILVVLIVALAAGGLALVTGAVVGPSGDRRFELVGLGVLIGLSAWPLRGVAMRIADRVVFGGRRTPYEIMVEFSHRIAAMYASDETLGLLARVAAEVVGADAAFVWLSVGGTMRLEAAWPEESEPGDVPGTIIEVRHHDEVLGALEVHLPASDPITTTKRGLLDDLAAQAGLVLRNVALVEDVRESRRRIVTAQDERARKLERDLHDGAQQQLVALAVKQGVAAAMVGKDEAKVAQILVELQQDTRDALENLRDLARGIYPPLLADRGLASAIEAQARKLPLAVHLETRHVERYAPEVEATIYFCTMEALNNVIKYSGAEQVVVTLAGSSGRLDFSVADDGRGFDSASISMGTGLQGMSDRLAALGGRFDIASGPGRGTTVSGWLVAVPVAFGV